MAKSLAIVVAQTNPTVGDLDGNLTDINDIVTANADADLVVFPECALTGYPLDDLVTRQGFLADVAKRIDALAAMVMTLNGPNVLVGAPQAGANLPFNAAFMLGPDGSRRIAHKFDRPNDGPFDEVRTFAQGDLRAPFDVKGVKVGVMICEEMWHPTVARHLAGELADVLVVINGSPYTRCKEKVRLKHARRRVQETSLPLIYVNMVGGQDELVFDGASFAVNDEGSEIMRMPAFRATERRIDLTATFGDGVEISCKEPLDPYPEVVRADYLACVTGLRDYVNKSKTPFKGVVIGESGGIDSALVTAIAVDALGPEKVLAVTMPSRITSGENLSDAHRVADACGVAIREKPIADVVAAFEELLGLEDDASIARENIQARARMTVLMAISNKERLLPVTTGNKSEVSVGYCTLYGDMAGGFNPIKDLYKTEVFAMAAFRNKSRPDGCLGPLRDLIPQAVIDKPPSAELAEGQTDEATLGPYVVLDLLLRRIVDDEMPARQAAREAQATLKGQVDDKFLTVAHADFIANLMNGAEHKRRQAAPGPKIGPRAYGRDRRYPIVNRHTF